MKSEEEEEEGMKRTGGGRESGGIQSGFSVSKHQRVCTVRRAPAGPQTDSRLTWAPPTAAHLAAGALLTEQRP